MVPPFYCKLALKVNSIRDHFVGNVCDFVAAIVRSDPTQVPLFVVSNEVALTHSPIKSETMTAVRLDTRAPPDRVTHADL